MLLKVGQVASRSGLTVRTLHHYDSIGLLKPSARSDAGYRLYGRDDIARLHQIQALRRLGLALAEIGTMLASPDLPFATIVERQIDMLDQQIDQATTLRRRLQQLRGQLAEGRQPELADLLTNLELMSMYDKYFTPEELKELPFAQQDSAAQTEWPAIVKEVQALMEQGAASQSPQAQAVAMRWMKMLERDTKRNPQWLEKLNQMHAREPALQAETGLTPELSGFVQQAFGAARMALYAKYLTPEEVAFIRANAKDNWRHWPPLIGEARQHMAAGTAPDTPPMQDLARRWNAQFIASNGDSPATRAKIRAANEQEPDLLVGTWIDLELLAYMRSAMELLPPQ